MNSFSKNLVLAMLPALPLRLDSVAIDDKVVILTVRSIAIGATCPVCGSTTTRLHSHYDRTLRDLPWGTIPVRVVLGVRRFRCARRNCPRRIFTERLPAVVTPHARSTTRYRTAFVNLRLHVHQPFTAKVHHVLTRRSGETRQLARRRLRRSRTVIRIVARFPPLGRPSDSTDNSVR